MIQNIVKILRPIFWRVCRRRFGFLEDDPIYATAAILTQKYGKRWLSDNEPKTKNIKIFSYMDDNYEPKNQIVRIFKALLRNIS